MRKSRLKGKTPRSSRWDKPNKDRPANYIPLGAPPKGDTKRAWWYLSKRAKEKLAEMRRAGYFGGRVGKAPYWYVQESGNTEVGIEPLAFVARAMDAFDTNLPNVLKNYFGGQ